MCNYKYEKKLNHLYNKPCIYPDLYTLYSEQFGQTKQLPIDDEGYCIFHSQNVQWKNENKFTEVFNELLSVVTEINKGKGKAARTYNFSGFHCCAEDSLPLSIDRFLLDNPFDFSFSVFANGLSITNSENLSLDIEYARFSDIFKVENTNLIDSYCSNAIFDNGVRFFNCQFEGNTFFENCTFKSGNKSKYCEFEIKNYPNGKSVNYISFQNSEFDLSTVFQNIIFNQEVNFINSTFSDEFIFDTIEVNGVINFKEGAFLLSNNTNPMYGSAHFAKLKINKDGRIVFKGKQPFEDMIKGELTMGFNSEPEGIISFENFNLNKIYSKSKSRLLELEKTQKVEIGKGCRKYHCQTEIFTIETSSSNQDLILDIVKVFCNYFKIEQGVNIGVEIVKRTESEIHYFYFTDEEITEAEFKNRIKRNETDLWDTLVNLTERAQKAVSTDNIGLIDCLLDLNNWWKKIGMRVIKNQLDARDLTKVAHSISLDKASEELIVKAFQEINNRFNAALENNSRLIIANPITMNNIVFNGKTEITGGNIIAGNQTNFNTEEKLEGVSRTLKEYPIDEDQMKLIIKRVGKILKESKPEKKESKWSKFIKEWLPVLTEAGVNAIKPFVLP